MRRALTVPLVCWVVFFVQGCDCGSGLEVSGDAGLDGGGVGDGGVARDGGVVGSGSDGGRVDAGTVAPEVCDGVDNDLNGIIDDVDVGHDGVCDCLKIATLGYRGAHGGGDVFANWLNGKSVAGAAGLERQTLTPALLAQYQVIVVQDVRVGNTAESGGVGKGISRDYLPVEVEALRAWVAGGGGVMTLTGYAGSTEIVNVNRLLSPFALAYDSVPILAKPANAPTVPITHWATHPLATSVMRVGVDNGYEVIGDAGVVIAFEPAAGAFDVAKATTYGQGHVYVWGDEWVSYNSEWAPHPDYQVERFWLNALKWLTPVNQCQVEIPVIN